MMSLRHDGVVFGLTKSEFAEHQTDGLPLFGQILLLLLGLTGVIRRRRIGKEQR